MPLVSLASAEEARALAEALVPVVGDWTRAEVHMGQPPGRCAVDPAPWYLEAFGRYLRISVPFARDGLLPWRVHSGAFGL